MRATFGNYSHDLNENLVGVSVEAMRNETGKQYARRVEIQIEGKLIAASQGALASAITSLNNGYKGNRTGNFSFKYADGTVCHQYLNSDSLGGVRVIRGPTFPQDLRAYISYVPYSITLEAVIPDTSIHLLSWDEVVSTEGGGPDFEHLVPVEGLPQKQQLHQATIYKATVQGSAVGQFRYPFVPPPIWPAALKGNPRIRRTRPRRWDSDLAEYRVEWEMEFESALPLVGVPRPPPLG